VTVEILDTDIIKLEGDVLGARAFQSALGDG
jgi:hypothetical protein